MDEQALALCLQHLRDAERLMVTGIDDWHRARVTHAIDMIEEAYRLQPPLPPAVPFA